MNPSPHLVELRATSLEVLEHHQGVCAQAPFQPHMQTQKYPGISMYISFVKETPFGTSIHEDIESNLDSNGQPLTQNVQVLRRYIDDLANYLHNNPGYQHIDRQGFDNMRLGAGVLGAR